MTDYATLLRKAPGFAVKKTRRALVARWQAWRFRRDPDHPALDADRARAALRDADSVLFLCWGNICRSPLAERRLRDRLEAAGVGDISVRSAGLGSVENRPSPPEAVAAAERLGVDLADHRSRLADSAVVADSDVVFVMDDNNYYSATRGFSDAADRTFFLGVFLPDGRVLPDPNGASEMYFDSVYAAIDRAIDGVADAIESREN